MTFIYALKLLLHRHTSVADKLMELISNNARWLLHNFEID